MRKIIVVALLFSSFPALYAALTKNQADKIQKQAGSIQLSASKLLDLGSALSLILNNGGTFSLPGSTQTYTISAQQEQDILDNYNDLKDRICTKACGLLP